MNQIHISSFFPHLSASAMMNQVCVLAKLARVGWGGFEAPPPTREQCIKAIEALHPSHRGSSKVIPNFSFNQTTYNFKKHTILGIC